MIGRFLLAVLSGCVLTSLYAWFCLGYSSLRRRGAGGGTWTRMAEPLADLPLSSSPYEHGPAGPAGFSMLAESEEPRTFSFPAGPTGLTLADDPAGGGGIAVEAAEGAALELGVPLLSAVLAVDGLRVSGNSTESLGALASLGPLTLTVLPPPPSDEPALTEVEEEEGEGAKGEAEEEEEEGEGEEEEHPALLLNLIDLAKTHKAKQEAERAAAEEACAVAAAAAAALERAQAAASASEERAGAAEAEVAAGRRESESHKSGRAAPLLAAATRVAPALVTDPEPPHVAPLSFDPEAEATGEFLDKQHAALDLARNVQKSMAEEGEAEEDCEEGKPSEAAASAGDAAGDAIVAGLSSEAAARWL